MTRARRRSRPRSRHRPPRRGHGYVFTGLVLGFGLGLLVAWVLAPVRYTDTAPDRLRADFKDAYRTLIALAYWGNPDLDRAQARLALLGDPDPVQALAVQAQRAPVQGVLVYEVEALRRLAAAVSRRPGLRFSWVEPTPAVSPTPSPTLTSGLVVTGVPTPSPVAVYTPTPTLTPQPTATTVASPTPAPFFRVFRQETVCDPARSARVQVEVYDAEGVPLPGIPLVVLTPQGERVIYTGLQPERGPGYADFVMEEGVVYRLQVQTGSEPADGLRIVTCRGEGGATYPGGWQVIFMATP